MYYQTLQSRESLVNDYDDDIWCSMLRYFKREREITGVNRASGAWKRSVPTFITLPSGSWKGHIMPNLCFISAKEAQKLKK